MRDTSTRGPTGGVRILCSVEPVTRELGSLPKMGCRAHRLLLRVVSAPGGGLHLWIDSSDDLLGPIKSG